ncbi:methyl-accepting chemotaxis protein [Gemmobacter lanyuensis]|uniref:Methyl-accepting chemotaxis protein n=1 Tax=Gemmobacter lanyuensis TaxID=1054497 RepID=A0A918IRY3_9RHOB|nr:methyl-accepting chemotaxis protein [Gemmobacter lanyuensis]GGW28213.1 methyl-accepting chemotaxis protein [Gemmobacter lanyuensis]
MTDHTDTAQAASARTDAQSPPPGGFGISLKTKIIGAAILLSVILVAMGLISYERFGEIRQNTRAIVQQNLPRMAEAARLDLAQQEIQTLIRDYALRPDATTRKPVQNQIDDLRKEQQIRLTHARDGATAASMKLLDEYAAKTAQINALIDGIFAADKNATAAGSAATGILQEGKLAALATEIKDIATRLGQEERLQAQRMAKASETIFWQVMALLRNFVIAGVAGAFAAGIWIMVSLTRGLRATGQLSASVAEGNLLVAPRLRGNDEMTALLGNMNRMVLAMRSVVADVAQGVGSVTGGASEMAQTSTALSTTARVQSVAIERASSSIEEIAANISETARNASVTEEAAHRAVGVAQEAGTTVAAAATAMQSIAEKISFVQEIARQTDLLALNAAVEAARAGEHGRGFAVVAAEVRKLSERSQEAASDIDRLSRDTVRTATGANDLLRHVVTEIETTARLVAQITRASHEMAQGVGEITQVVHQIDRSAQDNSRVAQHLSEAAAQLADQAGRLTGAVSFFRLEAQPEPASEAELAGDATPSIAQAA